MSKQIGLVCGSFHREEVSRMLDFAKDEAEQHGLTIGEVVWVPGSMEVPLALDRLLAATTLRLVLASLRRAKPNTAWPWVKRSSKPSLNFNSSTTRKSVWASSDPVRSPSTLNPGLSPMHVLQSGLFLTLDFGVSEGTVMGIYGYIGGP